jgi:hypothetical protein
VRSAAFVILVALAATPAHATDAGRAPQSIALAQRPGAPDQLVMVTTFGLLTSHDGGARWAWTCDSTVGYGGAYLPQLVVTSGGSIVSTSFLGIVVSIDGCSFLPTQLGDELATALARGGDNALHVAIGPRVFRSTNEAASFAPGLTLGGGDDTYTSIAVAPSDPQRVYVGGYRAEGATRVLSLYRSDNGGESYAPVTLGPFSATDLSELEIAAIAPADPDRVLVRVTWWNPTGVVGDAFWLTANGGETWTEALVLGDVAPAAVLRGNGDAVIGTRASGLYRSTDAGASFDPVAGPQPASIFCLVERPGGALWACTDSLGMAPFDVALMETTDLAAWTEVMDFRDDITAPVVCAEGTVQRDCCVDRVPACGLSNPSTWCQVVGLLGLADEACGTAGVDAAPRDGATVNAPGGCCDGGASGGSAGLVAIVLALYFGVRTSRYARPRSMSARKPSRSPARTTERTRSTA